MQMPAILAKRTVVVSGGASCANELRPPMRPATPADESVARKRRRLCVDCITRPLSLEIPREIRSGRFPNNDSTSRCGRTLLRCGIFDPVYVGLGSWPHHRPAVAGPEPEGMSHGNRKD